MNVIVAVQDQLHAMPFEKREQQMRVGQPLGARIRAQRVMNQQHAKCLVGGHAGEHRGERIKLGAANSAGGHQGRCRDCR